MTHGRRTTRFRVHFMATVRLGTSAETTYQDSMDISAFSPDFAARGLRQVLVGRHGEDVKIVVGKIKVLRTAEAFNRRPA